MNEANRLKYLSMSLYVFGAIFLGALPLMMLVWPAGWTWEPRQPEYEQMMMGIYATLGVFLIIAAKNPLSHRSLIQFTIASSAVHAAIMLVQALLDEAERPNLLGDVPGLFLVAIVLWVLLPKTRLA